jgi:hypothetical protein
MGVSNNNSTNRLYINNLAIKSDNYTIAGWFRFNALPGTKQVSVLAAYFGYTSPDACGCFPGGSSYQNQWGIVVGYDASKVSAGLSIHANEWMLVGIQGSTSNLKCTLILPSGSVTYCYGTSINNAASSVLWLLGSGDYTGDISASGVKVWHRVLSFQELQLESTQISPVTPDSLIAFWPLTGPDSSYWQRDYGPFNNDLTVFGTPIVSDDPQVPFSNQPLYLQSKQYLFGLTITDLGTANQTYDPYTQDAEASPVISSTVSQSYSTYSQVGYIGQVDIGAASQTLDSYTQVLEALQFISGTINTTYPSYTQLATNKTFLLGSAAQTYTDLYTQSVSGDLVDRGSALQLYGTYTQSNWGTVWGDLDSPIDQTESPYIQVANGTPLIPGAASQTYSSYSQYDEGTPLIPGSAAQNLGVYTQDFEGSPVCSGSSAQTYGSYAQSASGLVNARIITGAQMYSSYTQVFEAVQVAYIVEELSYYRRYLLDTKVLDPGAPLPVETVDKVTEDVAYYRRYLIDL